MVTFTSGAKAGGYKDCGPFGVVGSIKADNVSCDRARGVIKGFYRKAQGQGPIVTVKGFVCHAKITGSGKQDVRCNKGGGRQRVHYRGSIG